MRLFHRFFSNKARRPNKTRRLSLERLQERHMFSGLAGDFDNDGYDDLVVGTLQATWVM